MHIPENISDVFKFAIAIVIVIGMIVLVYTDHEIPTWLVIAVSSIIAYYFGLVSNSRGL